MTSTRQMKAALLHGAGDVRIEDISIPAPEDGQIRLKSSSVGICGSDLHHFREGHTGGHDNENPFVLGHELAGEVPEESAETLGIEAGTVVAVDPAHPCGACEWCERGHHNLCPNVEFKGVAEHPGGLAEYIFVYPDQVIPVPADFDADMAALLEPLGVAIHAVDLAEIGLMDTVAVLGAGPIGLLITQVVKAAGASQCFVVDPLAYRRGVATEVGAEHTSASTSAIETLTGGRGVDVVIEATNSPQGVENAIESVRIGGKVVVVGIPEGDEYQLAASSVRRKGLEIKFCRRMGEVYTRAIQLVERGRVDFDPIITHRFSLEEAPDALALQSRYGDGIIKGMVHP